jgi:hypothetical protein
MIINNIFSFGGVGLFKNISIKKTKKGFKFSILNKTERENLEKSLRQQMFRFVKDYEKTHFGKRLD